MVKKVFKVFSKPIVQLVERAAHDGVDVGSNPTRLINVSNYC